MTPKKVVLHWTSAPYTSSNSPLPFILSNLVRSVLVALPFTKIVIYVQHPRSVEHMRRWLDKIPALDSTV